MRILGIGHLLFGVALAGLAILSLIYGNFVPILAPFPASLPWPKIWAYGPGAILLAASLGLFFARTARASAIIIGACELAWTLACVPPVLLAPLNVGSWYGICEALAALAGTWILYVMLRRKDHAPAATVMTGERALRVARLLFGGACIEYGIAHFAYAAYTAKMVPVWFPDRMALVYLTGACNAAAGCALLLGILPRLAATLEAIMLTLFGILVWLPSFFTHPTPEWATPKHVQWSETFLNFVLAGAAWIVARSLRSSPWGFGPTAPDK
jgi:uncharacterized membrane protein YphA (DoxX/SURF4 family)